MKDINI